jgi:hypothetical protein
MGNRGEVMSDQARFNVFCCSICTQPVVLESRTTKADEAGKIVHESCYVEKLTSDEVEDS